MPLTPDDAADRTSEDTLEESADAAMDYVHANPIRALLAAAAIGFVLGRLLF